MFKKRKPAQDEKKVVEKKKPSFAKVAKFGKKTDLLKIAKRKQPKASVFKKV